MSVMVVQAGAARRVLDRSPEQSLAALRVVESTGRETLEELRRMLGALRPAGHTAELQPAPRLGDLGTLVERARATGLHVDLQMTGEPPELPATTDLTIYRIVQEALTNALKHAGETHASVRIEFSARRGDRRRARHGAGRQLRRRARTGPVRQRRDRGRRRARPSGPRPDRHARARRTARRRTRRGAGAWRVPRPRPHPTRRRRRASVRRDGDPPRMTPVRLLIADDQSLVRTGFRMILDEEESLSVIGEAADGLEAVEMARGLKPDVVLMDIRMPGIDGIEATRRILAEPVLDPPVRVLVLTTFDLNEYVYDALRAGASGFLLKDVPAEQLIAGVHLVASGEALLAPTVTRRLIEEFARHAPAPEPPEAFEELTPREIEVFGLVARGMSNAEIAASLVVSDATIKTHVARVLMKLGLRDRIQAVVLAYETGIITPGEGGTANPAATCRIGASWRRLRTPMPRLELLRARRAA